MSNEWVGGACCNTQQTHISTGGQGASARAGGEGESEGTVQRSNECRISSRRDPYSQPCDASGEGWWCVV